VKHRLQPRTAQAQQPQRTIDSPYLTAHEAVEYLHLGSLSALYRLIEQHKLPHGRLGRHYRFDRRELDAFLRGFGSAIEFARFRKQAS
jgi:excisionase family DNA binding protein